MPGLTAAQAIRLLRREGAMLQSARGPLATLTHAIAGEAIRGSWWGHPAGKHIFAVLSRLHELEEVAACKAVDGKITLVHQRLWPALVAAAGTRPNRHLDRVRQEHQASGEHRNMVERWPRWIPAKVRNEAKGLALSDAKADLGPLAPYVGRRS
jgi:hypothetical protein